MPLIVPIVFFCMTWLFSKRSRATRPLSFSRRSRFPLRWLLMALVTCALAIGGGYVWTAVSGSIGSNPLDNPAVASQLVPPQSLGEALDRSIKNFQQQVSAREQDIVLALGGPPPSFAGRLVRDQPLASGEKVVALTFDDGPAPTYTEQVLDILKREDVKATFFVIGQMFQAFPAIGQRVANEGHVLANHTWSHRYHRHAPAAAASEIERTAAIIEAKTGQVTRLHRPPGGVLNNGVDTYAQSKGYASIMWGTDTGDWRRPPAATIVSRVMNTIHPGDIVLMHDGGGDRRNTVAALSIMISQLKAKGYRFVTMPELLQLRARETQRSTAQAPTEKRPSQPKTPAVANPAG